MYPAASIISTQSWPWFPCLQRLVWQPGGQVVTFPALSFLTQNLSRMPQTQWCDWLATLGSWDFCIQKDCWHWNCEFLMTLGFLKTHIERQKTLDIRIWNNPGGWSDQWGFGWFLWGCYAIKFTSLSPQASAPRYQHRDLGGGMEDEAGDSPVDVWWMWTGVK